MRQLPNIAIIGGTRSGKDTFYKYIKSLGYPVKRVAFGDVLKEQFHSIFTEIPVSPKPIKEYVEYGQALRSIDPLVFVRPTLGAVLSHRNWREQTFPDEPMSYIFTDIRQQNEMNAFKKLGGVVVRVFTDECEQSIRMLMEGVTPTIEMFDAPTEKYYKEFEYDHAITNIGTVEEYHEQIDQLLKHLEVTN